MEVLKATGMGSFFVGGLCSAHILHILLMWTVGKAVAQVYVLRPRSIKAPAGEGVPPGNSLWGGC